MIALMPCNSSCLTCIMQSSSSYFFTFFAIDLLGIAIMRRKGGQ